MRILLSIVSLYVYSNILTDGAKILAVFNMISPSHYILGSKLLKTLAEKGHQVTSISPFPQKEPVENFRDVTVANLQERVEGNKTNHFDMGEMKLYEQIHFVYKAVRQIVEVTLNDTDVKTLLTSKNETFDLLIFDILANEALLGLSYKYNCPVVLLNPTRSNVWTNNLVGNPAPYSYVPYIFLGYSNNMSFLERVVNTLANLGLELYHNFYHFPHQNQILQKYFPDSPDLWTLMYSKVDLILHNSHVSVHPPVPHMPNSVDIGGFHIDEPKVLPKNLQQFMDEAKEGVIYFSMGSNLKSKDMSEEVLKAILTIFSTLPCKILWKWENDFMPAQLKNVKLGKWFPQQDVLAHPNTRLFITHGGLLSIIEAVYYGVPLVGIPTFFDQKMNMAVAAHSGFAQVVPFQKLSEETLRKALNEVLNTARYTQNVKRRSALMKDQPLRPLDKAVYWIEHILRHKGGKHLRSNLLELRWYQYILLDVLGFLIAIVVATVYLLWLLFRCLYCQRKTVEVQKASKMD